MSKENKEKVSVRLEPLHIAFVQADAAIQKRSFAAMLDLVIGEYYGRRSGSEPQYGFVRGLMEAQFAHEHQPIRSWEGAAPTEHASTIPAPPDAAPDVESWKRTLAASADRVITRKREARSVKRAFDEVVVPPKAPRPVGVVLATEGPVSDAELDLLEAERNRRS